MNGLTLSLPVIRDEATYLATVSRIGAIVAEIESVGEVDDGAGEDPERGEVNDELERLLRDHADIAEGRAP